jgi:hypothetical protein
MKLLPNPDNLNRLIFQRDQRVIDASRVDPHLIVANRFQPQAELFSARNERV